MEKQTRNRDEALILEAKTLARLQMRRKALNKDLREVNRQINVTKRNLKQLTAPDFSNPDWLTTGATMKIFGGGQ